MKRYRLTKDRVVGLGNRIEYKAGVICYRFGGIDYGCAADDEKLTGVSHAVMTLDPNGGTPFFTVPYSDIEVVEATQEEIENHAKGLWYKDDANNVDWPYDWDHLLEETKARFRLRAKQQLNGD